MQVFIMTTLSFQLPDHKIPREIITFLKGAGYLLTTAENELGVVIARFAMGFYF